MAADDLTTQGTKASTAMILILSNRHKSVPERLGLIKYATTVVMYCIIMDNFDKHFHVSSTCVKEMGWLNVKFPI